MCFLLSSIGTSTRKVPSQLYSQIGSALVRGTKLGEQIGVAVLVKDRGMRSFKPQCPRKPLHCHPESGFNVLYNIGDPLVGSRKKICGSLNLTVQQWDQGSTGLLHSYSLSTGVCHRMSLGNPLCVSHWDNMRNTEVRYKTGVDRVELLILRRRQH